MSRRRRWLTRNRPLVIVGAVILAIILVAGIVPQFVIAGLRQMPKDEAFSYSSTPAAARAVDLSAFREGAVPEVNAAREECAGEEPSFSCFVIPGEAEFSREVETASTETRKEVAVSAASALSVDGSPILEIEDFVRLQSHSAFPVPEPSSSMEMTLPQLGDSVATGEFSRNGLQYFFPYNTERVSYAFFDPMIQLAEPLDFVDRVEHEGLRSYEFQQTVPAVDLMSSMAQGFTQPHGISDAPEMPPLLRMGDLDEEQREAISSLRVNGAASQFYSAAELASEGMSATDRVSLSPYYSVDRTLWVEPQSGTVIDRVDRVWVYLAAGQDEADEMAAAVFAGSSGVSSEASSEASGGADAAGEAGSEVAEPFGANGELSERTVLATELAWDTATTDSAQEQAKSDLRVLKALEVISLLGNTIVVFLAAGALIWWMRRRYKENRTIAGGGVAVEGATGVDGVSEPNASEGDVSGVGASERDASERGAAGENAAEDGAAGSSGGGGTEGGGDTGVDGVKGR
ncbi:porin PorA family protein [Corynebacterium halotolerans]|uniref:porin PorA family protein n=1 Tax=Corynebacterium halotolerans TaxID=225326 RepID=UPI003CEF4EE4